MTLELSKRDATERFNGVGNIFTPVPKNPKSHVRGWAEHWLSCFPDGSKRVVLGKEATYDRIDNLFFDHGVNTGVGQLNLFGGITDDIAANVIELVNNPTVTIWSLDFKWGEMAYAVNLRKRLEHKTTSPLFDQELLDKFEKHVERRVIDITQYQVDNPSVTVGDSHSTAFGLDGQPVLRTNGLTLHGALKREHFREELHKLVTQPTDILLCAGSIDIRHHLMRQDDPWGATRDLSYAYAQEVIRLQDEFLANIRVCAPVPVEHEERKIPKTGWYEDAPFAGTRQERLDLTKLFIDCLHDDLMDVVSPPSEWYDMSGEEYAATHMELASSVHIAPTSYRRKGGWER